jgi:NitT/TauT family transport system substrate-binding protein
MPWQAVCALQNNFPSTGKGFPARRIITLIGGDMNKRFAALISMLSALVLLASSAAPAIAAPAPAAAPIKVRIGTQPWIGYGPWWIAKEKGLFEKYGLEAELIDFVEDKEVNAAFASGNMEAANLATHTAIKLFSVGVDLKLVLLEDVSTTADAILAGEDIKSIADLKGKQVAYEEGTTSDLLLNYALMQNKMTLDDIVAVPMPASDAGTALMTGKVPAAVTYEPYISEALKENTKLKALYQAKERPGLISDVLVISGKFAKEKPEAAKALLKVWGEALDFYNKDNKAGQEIIAKAVGSAPEDLITAFDGVKFYDLAANQKDLNSDFASTIKDVADVSKSIGLFDKVPDLTKLVDTSFLK